MQGALDSLTAGRDSEQSPPPPPPGCAAARPVTQSRRVTAGLALGSLWENGALLIRNEILRTDRAGAGRARCWGHVCRPISCIITCPLH